ncbi:MAG: NAD-dependent epimerase/dehydratase family protein [Salinisphaeraceae bacterium]|nr:NAD-dependent epimerase/dehydratase family protein [Salinisphaeraceae bacterium]
MARIFVTGGSGFVGRNLIRALVQQGDEVVALGRSPKARLVVEELGALAAHGDLDDVDALREGMRGCDAVIHAAALAAEWGDKGEFERFNVQGTHHVIEAAQAAGLGSLIHISTEAVMADGGPMVQLDESQPLPRKPLPRYPATKGQAESAVRQANSPDFRTVVVRPRMIWGKDDSTLLPAFAEAIHQGRFMWIDGGHYLTSTTHVDNVVEGVLLALEKGQGGEIYYVTDGEAIEFRQFLSDLLATQKLTPPDKSLPRWLAWRLAQACEGLWDALGIKRPPPITRFVVAVIGQEVTINDNKARQELGYVGRVSRQAGLASIKNTSA